MATEKAVSAGPVTRYAVANIRRLRLDRDWSYAELETKLKAVAGHSIRASGLHRLENGARRIDVDDLTAFAVVFEVSPIALLMPHTVDGAVELTTKPVTVEARAAWEWLRARRPLPDVPGITEDDDPIYAQVQFQRRSLPLELRSYPHRGAGLEALQEDRDDLRVVRVSELPDNRPVRGDDDG